MQRKHKIISFTAVFAVIVAGVFIFGSTSPVFVDEELSGFRFNIATGAPVNPGSEESGVVNILVYPYQSDTSVYNNALNEANAWSHFPDPGGLDQPLEGDGLYDQRFDIVVVAQYNYSVAYNTSSSDWDTDWVAMLMTSADLGVGVNTSMSKGDFHTVNAGEDARINFYIQNVGFDLPHGSNVNMSFIQQAFW